MGLALSPKQSQPPHSLDTLGVRTGVTFLLTLVFVLLVGAGCSRSMAADPETEWPAHLVGTWSNKKGDFKTISLGLRSDGRGVMSSAVFPMLARWQATAKGVHVRVTFPAEEMLGQVREYDFAYDMHYKALMLETESGMQMLTKIASEEPEDLEAKVEAGMIEERQLRESRRPPHVESTSTRADLIARLPSLLECRGKTSPSFSISLPDQGWSISATAWENHRSGKVTFRLAVLALKQSVESPSTTLKQTRLREEVVPELPTLYRMPTPSLKSLQSWLDKNDFKHSLYITLGKSIWEIEQQQKLLLIEPVKDIKKLARAIDYLLSETFAVGNGKLRVFTRKRADMG